MNVSTNTLESNMVISGKVKDMQTINPNNFTKCLVDEFTMLISL